jgi:hypothetical protein
MQTMKAILSDGPMECVVDVVPPAGWQIRELPGGSVAVVAPTRPGLFTANMVIGASDLGEDGDSADAVDAARMARDVLPELAVLGDGEFTVQGRLWWITEYAYLDEDAGTLMQCLRVAVAADGGPMVRCTATCSAATVDADLPVLREVMNHVTW